MDESLTALCAVLALVLAAEFVNGWTDAPNAIATVIYTRTLTPRAAVLMAAGMNTLGVLSGTAVATTIGKGIVDPASVDLVVVGAAMASIVIWSSAAARWGIPTSESHALVAGLAGAGVATAGWDVLVWSGWKKVLLGLLFSTFLGFVAGVTVMVVVTWAFRRVDLFRARKALRVGQVFSSAFMAFSHGTNDGQKFMGAFALALVLGGATESFEIPWWVIVVCAAMMTLGTLAGGWRIMRTMGQRVTRLETHQGFAAEMAAATTIELATRLGVPLSTTHTIGTAVMGVGSVRGFGRVHWHLVIDVLGAWVLTFPGCALLAWALTMLARAVA